MNIRRLQAHEWETYRAIRLRSLADAPDAFGSTLAAEQVRTPQDWAGRLALAAVSGIDYPLVTEEGGEVVGLLWAKVDSADAAVVNIYQVWVAPESRTKGVAQAMLRSAIDWSRSRKARAVQLGVTCGDTAAGRLYLREGFEPSGPPEARQGSPLFEQPMRLLLA